VTNQNGENSIRSVDSLRENQVGKLRDLLFRPKARVKSLVELNAWLEDRCIAYARRTNHP
jgi:hypothetical protein